MVILIFSFFFLAVILVTQSYKCFSRYYSTIHFVACLSLFYTLICRGHLLWQYSTWWIISPSYPTSFSLPFSSHAQRLCTCGFSRMVDGTRRFTSLDSSACMLLWNGSCSFVGKSLITMVGIFYGPCSSTVSCSC